MVRKYRLKYSMQVKLFAKHMHLKMTGTADGAANMFARKHCKLRGARCAQNVRQVYFPREQR